MSESVAALSLQQRARIMLGEQTVRADQQAGDACIVLAARSGARRTWAKRGCRSPRGSQMADHWYQRIQLIVSMRAAPIESRWLAGSPCGQAF
jgi:hypothetical protein